jgi:anthranilate phosphoribosyltransferase
MKVILEKVLSGETLTRQEMHDILIGITQEKYPTEQIAALLTALQMRGITVDELLGFRDGILETGVPALLQAPRYIDIVGTGGDQKNTFNISTCACLVVAGAGYKVAKHGNYAATSVSGASNVIEEHGVKFTNDTDTLNRQINESGFTYLHAPLFARAMKFVAPIRKNISFPTIFNLLGPIVNPSQPKCQLLGVATLDQMRLYNAVYQRLGVDYCIENSIDGYDEISLTGNFKITTNSYERIVSPTDIGLPVAKADELKGGQTKEEAVKIFDNVLANTATETQKNVVIANAAYAIQTIDTSGKSIEECVNMARESIESGKALAAFKKYVELGR